MVLQYFKILRFYAGKEVPSLTPGPTSPGEDWALPLQCRLGDEVG